MSNKPYDADYTTKGSEEEIDQSRKQALHNESFPSRAQRHRAPEPEIVKEEKSDSVDESKRLPTWLRVIFWILRKSIAPIIMIVMLFAGLYIGYVIVGGQPKDDVFEFSTWKHMWDLIFAES